MKRRVLLIPPLALALLLGMPGTASAHPYGVYLRDASGNVITAGSQTPYSPKQTCGTCHTYESDPVSVAKDQTVGGVPGATYNVTVPSHGASSGFHFQQGMDVPWSDTQRSFYSLPGFTSSPGMIGKY